MYSYMFSSPEESTSFVIFLLNFFGFIITCYSLKIQNLLYFNSFLYTSASLYFEIDFIEIDSAVTPKDIQFRYIFYNFTVYILTLL